VIQGIVEGAEGIGPPRHLRYLVPDSDPIGFVLEPPDGYQEYLRVDRKVFQSFILLKSL
jgi:hypothetical protein